MIHDKINKRFWKKSKDMNESIQDPELPSTDLT